MPASERQEQALLTYAGLMEEAKIRLNAVEAISTGKLKQTLPPLIAAESGYLQLRVLCELIALGCLVAHGDIKEVQSKKLRKAWEADRIVRALEKLHPTFYPTPMKKSSHAPRASVPERRIHALEELQSGFLTKVELIKLYTSCGGYLHRGSITSFASREAMLPRFDQMYAWANQIGTLLKIHVLALFGQNAAFYCFLNNRHEIGRVQIAFAEGVTEERP